MLNFKELTKHLGHNIVCVGYRDQGSPTKPIVSTSIECEDCNEVLISFDK